MPGDKISTLRCFRTNTTRVVEVAAENPFQKEQIPRDPTTVHVTVEVQPGQGKLPLDPLNSPQDD